MENNHVIGGYKAREKNLARNPNHYSDMGKKGGKLRKTVTGFTTETAKSAGSKGGSIGRRGHKYQYEQDGYRYYIKNDTKELVKYPI